MGHLFTIILVQPLLNFLVWVYNVIPGHTIGIGIILLTIVVRLILAPSLHKSLKSQKLLASIQPKINELREKHKSNQAEQAQALMNLYKEHKVSPFSSCLPILIQLPILFALYRVFIIGLGDGSNLSQYLYNFVSNPGQLNPNFLGVNLANPNIIYGLIAGISQYIQSKMMVPATGATDPTAKALMMQTLYVLPVITVLISLRLPAGLPLYWIVNTLFAIGQQYYIMRDNKQNTEIKN
jgi:YidC/Oxa1 family membrane protein insertase